MAHRQRQVGQTGRTGGVLVTSDKVAPPVSASALQQAKNSKIDQLWTAADAYEKNFFSGGAHALILEYRLKGDAKAIAMRNWIDRLWLDYYSRKDVILSRGTIEEVMSVDIIFSGHGNPPHSIRDLLNMAVMVP